MAYIGKTPTPQPLGVTDIPDLPATKITSGTFPALNASNLTSLTAGNLTGTLPAISGANLTGVSAGKIAQVVSGSSSGVVTTNSSSFLVCATVNITPSATTSKVLILGGVGEPDQLDGQLKTRFFRGSTELNSSEQQISTEFGRGLSNTGVETHRGTVTQQVLDSPNTTSQVTYSVKMVNNTSGTVRCGNGGSNTIIVLEVLA